MSSFESLQVQRKLVKRDLKAQPAVCTKYECERGADHDCLQRWEPVPVSWFKNWKQYVDFDNESDEDRRTQDEIDALHPGQIDSSCLLGDLDELRRDLTLDVDYVLLLHNTVNKLFTIYSSSESEDSPRFARWARNAGTEDVPKMYVKLYPSRVEMSKYKDSTNEVVKFQRRPCFYLYDKTNFKEFQKELKDQGYVSLYDEYRVWYKLKKSTESETVGEEKAAGALRYITKDSTSTVNGWKLLHSECEVQIDLLLTERYCIEIMLEFGPTSYYYKLSEEDWPLHKLMNTWKENLQRGDVIDVFRGKDSKWLEAIVKAADEGGVEVHYKSFEESDDEKIPIEDFGKRLAPLESHTINWKTAIEEDDLCDVKIDGVWVQGCIESVSSANNKVLVCYNQALVEYYKSHGHIVEASADTSALNVKSSAKAGGGSYGNDDDNKKNYNSYNSYNYYNNSVTVYEKPKPKIVEPDVDSSLQSVWFQLDLEDIAYISTHSRETHRSRKYLESKKETKSTFYDYGDRASKGVPIAPGCVGFVNIGNTCYMNSMLQCLIHAKPIAEIFTSGRYREQLNRDNPIGFGGKLAKSYAQLMKDVYSNNYTTVVPRQFKTTIGQCYSQFDNFDQQDSQELLGFLVDGLHEDLNRIKKKPYVQTIRGNDRPDEHVSADSWRRFLLRNDSELTDLMYMQTKSTVTCANPSCKKQHVTFEPLTALPLPVPENSSNEVMRVLVRLLPYSSDPFEVDVKFNAKNGLAGELKRAIVKRLIEIDCISPEQASSMFFQVYCNSYHSYDFKKDNEKFVSWYNPSIDLCVFLQTESSIMSKESYREYNSRSYRWEYKFSDDFSGRLSVLLFSSKKTKTYFDEVEHIDAPIVMTFVNETTTGSDVHQIVKEYAQQFVPADFNMEELSSLYDVYKLSRNRIYSSDKIYDDESIFDPLYSENVSIVWKNNANLEPKVPSYMTSHFQVRVGPKAADESGKLSVYKCLEKFLEDEQLPQAETFYCNVCKERLAPQKKIDLYMTPDILVIHLKRFEFSTSQYGNVVREKITDLIDYPLEGLDLSRYVKGPIHAEAPPIYDLVGVSLHRGSLQFGHYTAVCKDEDSGNFYEFDDSTVSVVDKNSAVSELAYVLFYKRQKGSLKWGGIRPTEGESVLPDDP